jgi:hypothetical protein
MYDEFGMTEGEREEADRMHAWLTLSLDEYHDIYGTLPPLMPPEPAEPEQP